MPSVSEKQHRAMEAAAHGHSTLGIPKSVGEEFVAADSWKAKCAGLLFIADGKVLLLHRVDRDEWEGPGGHVEDGESAREAAIRECLEEIGVDARTMDVAVRPIETTSGPADGLGIDYKTFYVEVESGIRFPKIRLNHEHDDYDWFPMDDVPKGTHPGVKEVLSRLESRHDSTGGVITETDIAKAIRDGELESPQRIGDLWLFDVRITGTGVSYRPKHEEYVYRPPEFYLTDEFLARCSGLPVIFDHPEKKGQIDTDEWRQRAIGSIVLPYIPNETTERKDPTEVWGIARIHDGDAAELMMTSHISTSPAVKFGAAGSTKTVRMDDGSRLMIEGNPNYIDHLAVCPEGVWDKGGEPRGVNTGT